MIFSLFPQRARDIPAILAASSGLSASHVIPVANVSLESGAPTSIGRLPITGTTNGGSVTQVSLKTAGVTLNSTCGTITTAAASLATATTVAFTLTNSKIAATDVVVVCEKSGGTTGAYSIHIGAVADGSCQFEIRNQSGSTLSEAIVLNFIVIKAAIG